MLLDPSHYPLSAYISLAYFFSCWKRGAGSSSLSPFPLSQSSLKPLGGPFREPLKEPENGGALVDIERSRFAKGGKENDRHGARDRATEKGERSNCPLQAVFRVAPKTGVRVSSPLATRKPPFLETNNRQEPLLSKNPCQKTKGYCDSPSFVF